VQDILTDCDQDVVWVNARLTGDAACHTGRPSCFYRRVKKDGDGVALERIVNGRQA
jgi:phosphoribosyl-AMP cyclohydrolase